MTELLFSLFSLVRFIVTFFALFLVPGYAFSSLLFHSLNPQSETKFLAFASSIAISSLIGVGQLWINTKINILTFYIILSIITLSCWLGVLIKNKKFLKGEFNRVKIHKKIFESIIGGFIMGLGLLFIINPTSLDSKAQPSSIMGMTEFYFSSSFFGNIEEGALVSRGELLLPVEIENHYDQQINYLIIVVQGDQVIFENPNILVEPGEHLQENLLISTEDFNSGNPC